MAAGLYRHEPAFTTAIDQVFEAMGRHGGPLRDDWLTDHPRVPLDHVTRSQPLLFAVDYALGRLLHSHGVRPAALLGHSIGELAAATLAGMFSLADAAALVLDRVGRLATAPPGGMLAVAASTAELTGYLTDQVVVAAVNAPRQTIVAGPCAALDGVAARLRGDGFTCRPVPSHSAFHSPMLAPAARGAEALFGSIQIGLPAVPVYSGYTAAPLGTREARDPAFWARQPVAPVRFWPALDRLLAAGPFTLVEAGPGQGLSQIARRHRAVRAGESAVIPLLPARPASPEADRDLVRAAVAVLAPIRGPVLR
jgi:acyl transferase domain-containing protein